MFLCKSRSLLHFDPIESHAAIYHDRGSEYVRHQYLLGIAISYKLLGQKETPEPEI